MLQYIKKYEIATSIFKDKYSISVFDEIHSEDANFNLPIYLDNEIQSFISKIAKEQKKGMQLNEQ